MSGNDSIGENNTNTTDDYSYSYTAPDILYIYTRFAIFFIVVGAVLNLWFLVAILRSQDTRSRLRNKIICNSLVLHLVDIVFILPLYQHAILSEHYIGCIFYYVVFNLAMIQDFIGNWLLVMVLAVFIAQIQDFNPKMKLSPRTTTLGTAGLLVVPWIISLVLVPVIVHEYNKRLRYSGDCPYPGLDATEVLKSIDTVLPILLSVILLIAAVFLRYKRLTRGDSSNSSMQTQLMSRGPEIDSSVAYIVATAVCIFCDLLQLIFALNVRYSVTIILYGVSLIMSHSRSILMPLPWLLLPDIRQRIKTWRPWYSPTPGIDLTVNYRKEDN